MYTSQPRRFAIPTTSDAPTWDEWRAAFRHQLRERLGALPSEQAPVSVTAADRLDKDVFAGGHQINGAKAYDFLWRWLSEKDR
jgi:hypothetical protein